MGDEALRPMARVFEKLGYVVYGWGQGRNYGLRVAALELLQQHLQAVHERHRLKVSLVGWSAGGLYARELARARPQWVRRLVVFGSPIRPQGSADEFVNVARKRFDSLVDGLGQAAFAPNPVAPTVPCTAIHSKTDGLVSWRAALEVAGPHVENLEVEGTHLAMGFNLEVLRLIAERLPIDPEAKASKKRVPKPRRKID